MLRLGSSCNRSHRLTAGDVDSFVRMVLRFAHCGFDTWLHVGPSTVIDGFLLAHVHDYSDNDRGVMKAKSVSVTVRQVELARPLEVEFERPCMEHEGAVQRRTAVKGTYQH